MPDDHHKALEAALANALRATPQDAAAIIAAVRSAYDPNFVNPFAHLRGRNLFPDDAQSRAMRAWLLTLAMADEIVRNKARADAEAKAQATVQATADAILRAGKIARGEIVELPRGETARAILAAGRRRRADERKDTL